jgi:purine-nucleoside/S-methyl-5'-thioadenosine phosphorylase / adenosine deaminase
MISPRAEVLDEQLVVELPGARAAFTTSHGGVSSGPYRSLNLGRLTDDDPSAVQRNRALLEDRLGMPLAMIRQVHGAEVRRISSPEPRAPLQELDGQAVSVPGVAPIVLVADCLPIAVAGDGAAAILHAGWRGLAGGIVEEGVRAVRELGAVDPLEAVIGPGAGACCYEVGEEVHAHFTSYGPAARNGRNLDLKAVARYQLGRAGVRAVRDLGLCTICSEDFFSHRRAHGVTGRQAGVVWLS